MSPQMSERRSCDADLGATLALSHLKGGALASAPEAVYCRHHEKLAELHGGDAVRAGQYPQKRSPKADIAVVAEPTNLAEAGRPAATAPSR